MSSNTTDTSMTEAMVASDYVVLSLYFVVILFAGLFSTFLRWIRRKKNDDTSEDNTNQYFLAGRDMTWWAVGSSLFCSNIGSEHFVGLAGTAAKEGIAVGWNEWTGIFMILILAYVFVPIYFRTLVFTTPEYIEKRFNKHIRTYLAILSLFIYIFTKISVSIFAGAVVMEVVLGWNLWVSAAVMLIFTGLYTVLGGMSAVIWTEVLQTIILLVGSITISIASFNKVGGLPNLVSTRPEMFHLFRPATDSSFPWTAVVLGMPVINLWYWCIDQVMVQRTFAAKNEGEAKTGCLLAAVLKVPMMFILVMPGVVAGHLYPNEVARDSNTAFPLMVRRLMPPVLKGFMISAMLAAAMSTLASVFNSASTIFTMDIYQKLRGDKGSQKELVWVGRIGTLTLCILSVAWIPFIKVFSDQLFIYLTSVTSYTAPPIAAVFLLGASWDGATSLGAAVTLVVGLVLGMLRFILEISLRNIYNRRNIFFKFVDLNAMNFGFLLFLNSLVILFVVSLLTPTNYRSPDDIADCMIDKSVFYKDVGSKEEEIRSPDIEYSFIKTPPEIEFDADHNPMGYLEETNQEIQLEQHSDVDSLEDHTNLDYELMKASATAVESWHKYTWVVIPPLLVVLIALIVIFR
ncbi:hypothetical protein AKO1_006735 [Acrasis kona]|uniref:Uncharacterized protein n=1 Tax=Acrasis kona TaxID=1008807 RepID=A0AAW2ZL65_9EUKA